MKVVWLSALRTGGLWPRRCRWYSLEDESAGRFKPIQNPIDAIGDRNHDFPTCSALPTTRVTAYPYVGYIYICICVCVCVYVCGLPPSFELQIMLQRTAVPFEKYYSILNKKIYVCGLLSVNVECVKDAELSVFHGWMMIRHLDYTLRTEWLLSGLASR